MSKTNLNPQDNELPIRIQIVCSILQEYSNKLEKNQKPGDATRVENSGKLESLEPGMPIIDTKANSHQLAIDANKKEASRTIVSNNGNKVKENMIKVEIDRDDFESEEEYKKAYLNAYNKAFLVIMNNLKEWKEREGIEDKDKDQEAR